MSPPALLSLPDLPTALRALLAQIPRGCVTTFGDLATALGDIAAARWVAQWLRDEWQLFSGATGTALRARVLPSAKEHGHAEPCPWHPTQEVSHRVVLRTGELPHWTDELQAWQTAMLEADGVPFIARGRIDPVARWSAFVTDHPLRRLSEWQTATASQAVWTPWPTVPDIIGGVDLSYASPTSAVAAYVAVEVATGNVIFEHTVTAAVPFPYIPGYLTFRELPPLLALLDNVRLQTALAPVILVDGTGRLHPRQSGLAVSVGLCGGCTTVGVSKHQLCGQVREDDPLDGCPTIWQQSECLGVVMMTGSKRRTVFLSPGTGIALPSAIRMVRAVWSTERLPRPIARADTLSRKVARGR
ncbi:MAG TPA: endonuclease V [Planctomycetaceae bacterium]|nr:endonuclease V [Planctomycetaceae bacterium]